MTLLNGMDKVHVDDYCPIDFAYFSKKTYLVGAH